ncbi:MAG: type II toxin-antitoxin system VapC family toxin [Candidatus Desulfofervidus auxilii]|nr:type II toxin-antitoxin system VapC family toxin [Candidatus Desulfofervidus auxilii]
MIMLDTSFIIDLFKNPDRVKKYFSLIDKEGACLTSISYFEIFRAKRFMSKREISYFNQLFSAYPVYTFDLEASEKASEIWIKLERLGETVSVLDVMIGGIMLANGVDKIITRDRDFQTMSKVVDIEAIIV